MMTLCPHCGHALVRPLLNGITSCLNCRRTCDSTHFNKLLSLSWVVRKQHIDDTEVLMQRYVVSQSDAELVLKLVFEECCTHEEFIKSIGHLKEKPLDR